MNKEYFHKRIKETLDSCAYDFYVVHADLDKKCTCVTHATQEGDPACIMCLGTGRKIRIKKVRGASNDDIDNVGGRGVKGIIGESTIRTYFVDAKYIITEDDLIIDQDKVHYAFRMKEMRGFNGELTHREIRVLPYKNDAKIIIKNFNKIMEHHRRGGRA